MITCPFYTWDAVPKPRLSKGRKVVRIYFGFDAAVLHSTPVQNLPRLVAEHQRAMLGYAQSRLGLPDMPPLPSPDETWPAPRGAGPASSLSLAPPNRAQTPPRFESPGDRARPLGRTA